MRPYACYPGTRARFQSPIAPFMARPAYYQVGANEPKTTTTRPPANILRQETGFEIHLAVPGISKNQIKIEMIEDQLVISSTNPNQDEQKSFVRHEFDYLNFKRSFRLPKNADTANLKASFDQGILLIQIPDKAPDTRKIEII